MSMKVRSFLAAGCLAACLCVPQILQAQFPPRPVVSGGYQQSEMPLGGPTSTVFEFVVVDGGTQISIASVLCLDRNSSQVVLKNAAAVYSITNPPSDFELVVTREKFDPVTLKVVMPATSQPNQGGLFVQSRSLLRADRLENLTLTPLNNVVRAVVDLAIANPTLVILEPNANFNAFAPPLLTKNGTVPGPVQAGAGRAGDDCLGATPIACGDTETFTLQAFNADAVAFTSTCEVAVGGPFGNDKSVWFEFTPTATTATIDLCSSDLAQDSVMTIFTSGSACGALTELSCDDDSCPGIPTPPGFGAPTMNVGGLVPGQTYLILVDFYSGGYDPLIDNTITVTCGVALPEGACCMPGGACNIDTEDGCGLAGGNYQGDNSVCDGSCPDGAGDVCAIAVEVFDGLNSGTIFEAGIDDPAVPSCTGLGQDDTWFTYTATTAGSLLIETCGSFVDDLIGGAEIDTIVAVYDACGGAELDCDDDCTSGGGDPNAPCIDEDQTGFGSTRDSCVFIENVNAGDVFMIQVQEFLGGNVGGIALTVTPFANTGACCAGKSCSIETEANCATLAGTYLGDDTSCDAPPVGTPVSFSSAPNLPIPDDDPVGVSDTINVADAFAVGDVNVSIQIDHTFLGDLNITLTHNGATSALVMAGVCGTNENMDITIDDSGPDVVCAAPTVGTFNSLSLGGDGLSAFNGENSSGAWTLNVVDSAGFDLGTFLSWSLELDAAGPSPCDALSSCTADLCPDGTTPIVGVENGNFAGWCVSGAPAADVDFFFFRVDYTGDFALIEITKEFTQGPQAPTGLVPPILVTFFQVCDDADTVSSIIINEESVRNSTGVDWTDYHWNLFDAGEVWFDAPASSQWGTFPFTTSAFANFLDAPTNTKAKSLNADNGVVPNNSQYFPGSGTGVLKMDVDLSGPPVNFTFKQRPTIDGTPDPDGACCLTAGCQTLTAADCSAQSGAYQGDGVACTPDPCAPPVGACCNNGACTPGMTQSACEDGGGTYQGDGTDCGTASCPQPSTNDECEGREALPCGQTTFADLVDATNSVDDPASNCSTTSNPCTEFFEFVPTGTSARIRTDLNSTETDSVYTLYQVDQAAPCDETLWTDVGCSEDEGPGFLGDICIVGLTPGDTYVLMITGFSSFSCPDGPYGIDVDCSATCGP